MLKELAVFISNLSYSDMMEWCESDAFVSSYADASVRPKKMAEWAKKMQISLADLPLPEVAPGRLRAEIVAVNRASEQS